jgi:hypothetical protein
MPEEKNVKIEPKKEKSPGELKTDAFKVHIQAIIKDRLDVKVSKETAWSLFKDVIYGTLQFSCNQEDKRVPLSGVGTFEVIKAGARKSRKEEGKLYTPKFRFYPSTTIEKTLFKLMGEEDIDQAFKGLGIYNTEDALEKFTGQSVVNAEWLAKEIVKKQEEEE